MKKKYILIFLLSILLIFVSFHFQKELLEFKSLGLLGIFIINLVSAITLFIPAPGIVSVVAGGVVYEPILVAIVASLGSSLGEMVGFSLGHTGKHLFFGKHPKWYSELKKLFHKHGLLLIFIFSFIPNPVFDAVGIVAGMFHYPPIRFFVIILFARFLRSVLLAYIGSAI